MYGFRNRPRIAREDIWEELNGLVDTTAIGDDARFRGERLMTDFVADCGVLLREQPHASGAIAAEQSGDDAATRVVSVVSMLGIPEHAVRKLKPQEFL